MSADKKDQIVGVDDARGHEDSSPETDQGNSLVEARRGLTAVSVDELLDRLPADFFATFLDNPFVDEQDGSSMEKDILEALKRNDIDYLASIYIRRPLGGSKKTEAVFGEVEERARQDAMLAGKIYRSVELVIDAVKTDAYPIVDGLDVSTVIDRILNLASTTKDVGAVPYLSRYFDVLDDVIADFEMEDQHASYNLDLAALGMAISEIAGSNQNDDEAMRLNEFVLKKIAKKAIHFFMTMKQREVCHDMEWDVLESLVEALICFAKQKPDDPVLKTVAAVIVDTVNPNADLENFAFYYKQPAKRSRILVRYNAVSNFMMKLVHLVSLTDQELRAGIS